MTSERTNLGKTSAAVMFFCLPFGLVFSACAYALYAPAAPEAQSYWIIGLVISLSSIAVPIVNGFLCRTHDRVLVRGLGILVLGLLGSYIFGLVCCFYPLYFFPLGTPINVALNIVAGSILIIWTFLIFFDIDIAASNIGTLSAIFVPKASTIEFDLKNISFLRKYIKKRDFQSKIYYWIIIAIAPMAPFLSRMLSHDSESPYFYYVIFAISAPIFLCVWRAFILGITALFFYPLYLELKTKKVVVEVGSFRNNGNPGSYHEQVKT